jgi:2-methylcitrate dehydratase PrpD
MSDGRVFEKKVEHPRGSKMNPMSLQEIKAKFQSCAQRVLVQNKIDELQNIIFRLENLEDTAELCKPLAK